jgi:2-methylcitrate dehydratase PrpD
MAATTVASAYKFDQPRLLDAMSIALAGWNGRAGRPAGSPSARWIAFADGVQKGISAAHAAANGFRGDAAIGDDIFGSAELRELPNADDIGFKPFPIARQAATVVEAFQKLPARGIDPATTESIVAVVPRINVALLTRPVELGDRSSLLCNLGLQLACAALAPDSLYDPERKGMTPAVIEFAKRVTVTPTDEFCDPRHWPVRLYVRAGGREYVENVDELAVNSGGGNQSLLEHKWRRTLKPDDRRDFFEHVATVAPGSHAMLWEWIKARLARAARSGA